jgi:hypothetical protein
MLNSTDFAKFLENLSKFFNITKLEKKSLGTAGVLIQQ